MALKDPNSQKPKKRSKRGRSPPNASLALLTTLLILAASGIKAQADEIDESYITNEEVSVADLKRFENSIEIKIESLHAEDTAFLEGVSENPQKHQKGRNHKDQKNDQKSTENPQESVKHNPRVYKYKLDPLQRVIGISYSFLAYQSFETKYYKNKFEYLLRIVSKSPNPTINLFEGYMPRDIVQVGSRVCDSVYFFDPFTIEGKNGYHHSSSLKTNNSNNNSHSGHKIHSFGKNVVEKTRHYRFKLSHHLRKSKVLNEWEYSMFRTDQKKFVKWKKDRRPVFGVRKKAGGTRSGKMHGRSKGGEGAAGGGLKVVKGKVYVMFDCPDAAQVDLQILVVQSKLDKLGTSRNFEYWQDKFLHSREIWFKLEDEEPKKPVTGRKGEQGVEGPPEDKKMFKYLFHLSLRDSTSHKDDEKNKKSSNPTTDNPPPGVDQKTKKTSPKSPEQKTPKKAQEAKKEEKKTTEKAPETKKTSPTNDPKAKEQQQGKTPKKTNGSKDDNNKEDLDNDNRILTKTDKKQDTQPLNSLNDPVLHIFTTKTKSGYRFYDINYGVLKDYVELNLRADHILFLNKRYIRTNSSKVIPDFAPNHDHILSRPINRLKFLKSDELYDRVNFHCYEDTTGKDYRATLTYEFYPKMILNINFKPHCSKDKRLNVVKKAKVYKAGERLLPEGEKKPNFDKKYLLEHALKDSENIIPLRFEIEDVKHGMAYVKNFSVELRGRSPTEDLLSTGTVFNSNQKYLDSRAPKVELEALKISKDLLQVSVDTRTSHMIEFTCSKEGSFDYDIKFEFQGDTYRIVGIKKCSLSAIGKDFEPTIEDYWLGWLMPLFLLAFGCFFIAQYSGEFKKLSQEDKKQHEYISELSAKAGRKLQIDEEEVPDQRTGRRKRAGLRRGDDDDLEI